MEGTPTEGRRAAACRQTSSRPASPEIMFFQWRPAGWCAPRIGSAGGISVLAEINVLGCDQRRAADVARRRGRGRIGAIICPRFGRDQCSFRNPQNPMIISTPAEINVPGLRPTTRGPCGPPVNLAAVVAGTIKAEGTANATADRQPACLP
jgi:hypothetical protein